MSTTNDTANSEKDTDNTLARRLEQYCAKAEEFLTGERLRMELAEEELREQLSSLKAATIQLAERSSGISTVEQQSRSPADDEELRRAGSHLASSDRYCNEIVRVHWQILA